MQKDNAKIHHFQQTAQPKPYLLQYSHIIILILFVYSNDFL